MATSAGNWKDLVKAAEQGDKTIVRFHLRCGVDPNFQHPEYLSTPLLEAIKHDQIHVIPILLKSGASVEMREDLTGLSVRALFMDMFGQTVILFFLIEKESSLLITVPAAVGCLIALWKCRKAAGLKYVKVTDRSRPVAWYNWIPRMLFDS